MNCDTISASLRSLVPSRMKYSWLSSLPSRTRNTCTHAWPCARASAIKSTSMRERPTTFCASMVRRTAMMRSRRARRRLEVEVRGGIGHLTLQAVDQRIVVPFEEQHHLVDEPVVVVFALIADARRQTALDVVLQARPLALAVDRLAAGAQREHDAHEVDQLAQAVRVGVRPEVARAVVLHDAGEHDARKVLVGDLEVRKAFVVAQPHVERAAGGA